MTARDRGRRPLFNAAFLLAVALAAAGASAQEAAVRRVGVIGLDTGHAVAFTQLLNLADRADHVPGATVVAAYPQGSRDIQSSVTRVPEYTATMRGLGVEIVDSIPALLERVDAVLLESNDGRVHLEQAAPVLAANKPVFIDKPCAGSLADVVAIFDLARIEGTPAFTSSALRFGAGTQAVRSGSIGAVLGCDTHSPCPLEPTHPDLFWYGIHGCESLFTVLGTGCESVTRTTVPDAELVVGIWSGGRIGTFRGHRAGKPGYGGTAFGAKGVAAVGGFDGYRPLVVEIVRFFTDRKPPVDERESLEIYAFMEAADESKRRGGARVAIADVLEAARAEARARVRALAPRDGGG